MKKKMSKVWLLALVFALVASLMAGCGSDNDAADSSAAEDVVSSAVVEDVASSAADSEEVAPAAKTVTVDVVLADGTSEEFVLNTDEEFLRGALESENLIVGTEGEFGLFVTEVNGVKADESKQEWWCFTKSGEMLMTGVDTTPVADGDHFEATLTVGY